MSIQIIPPIVSKDHADPFIVVSWDSQAKRASVTLCGGYTLDQRLSAAVVLRSAIEELEGVKRGA